MTISRQRLHSLQPYGTKILITRHIPKPDAAFWADAELRMPQTKKGRISASGSDILELAQGQGPGYQTRINAILRPTWRRPNSP